MVEKQLFTEIKLSKIISGGQTGVDKAALIAAKEVGLVTGGTAPRNYHTTNGSDFTLRHTYNLKESGSAMYKPRTRANILDSDATLILAKKMKSPGTRLTIRLCLDRDKPMYMVDLSIVQNWQRELLDIIDFLVEHNVKTLNCAGNSEVSCPGIQDVAYRFLYQLFKRIRP